MQKIQAARVLFLKFGSTEFERIMLKNFIIRCFKGAGKKIRLRKQDYHSNEIELCCFALFYAFSKYFEEGIIILCISKTQQQFEVRFSICPGNTCNKGNT